VSGIAGGMPASTVFGLTEPSLDDLAQNVEQKLMRFLNPRS